LATTRLAGVGDTFARLKINLRGDDGCAVALALLPYVKLPTARAGLGNGAVGPDAGDGWKSWAPNPVRLRS
jgi:hypothetical protein